MALPSVPLSVGTGPRAQELGGGALARYLVWTPWGPLPIVLSCIFRGQCC